MRQPRHGDELTKGSPVKLLEQYFHETSLSAEFGLNVRAYPARFIEQAYFTLWLKRQKDGASSRDPVFSGIFSMGRPTQTVMGWVDGDYFDSVSFPNEPSFSLYVQSVAVWLFQLLGGLVQPGGSLMVSYSLFSKESRLHRDTKLGLDRGYPPAVTPLGFLLFRAGCGMGFKDWYFAEGGREGPEKLQGYKPTDARTARERAEVMLVEVERFIQASQNYSDELSRDCRQRAILVVEQLRKTIQQ